MECSASLTPDELSRTGPGALTVIESGALRLPLSGWWLRIARGSEGRPALEVHSRAGLIDVSVLSTLSVSPLRGGRHSGRSAATHWSLAWGQLPPDGDIVEADFRGWRRSRCVQAYTVADAFWVAEVGGRFRSVTCSAGTTRTTGRVVKEVRSWDREKR
ncbi:hypothetical protein EST92_15060 [Streptomyces sp. TM32]|uniref:hypothetical protein n=1 Tax=Streptomyces sp. TM32 TaxID=1652669 RepID=UPI0010109DD7|nr:hypothetical protein [Streptomyces sp. TM32]RXS82189.1 hypothetical protein EST92_15060 [Streptomyces sp. TM32]